MLCNCENGLLQIGPEPPKRTPALNKEVRLLFLGSPLSTPLGLLSAGLGEGEHRVYEVHVGLYRLLGELPRSLLPPLGVLGQLLARLYVGLCVALEVVDDAIEELLGHLGIELLSRFSTTGHRLVRLSEGLCEPLGRLVNALLLLVVHGRRTPFWALNPVNYKTLNTLGDNLLHLKLSPIDEAQKSPACPA